MSDILLLLICLNYLDNVQLSHCHVVIVDREPYLIKTKDGRKQTLAEYERSLVEDYKRRSQLNLAS